MTLIPLLPAGGGPIGLFTAGMREEWPGLSFADGGSFTLGD